VLDDFSTGRKENLSHRTDRLDLIEGDIRDAATCRRACEGVTLVFHQAALGSVPRSMKEPATTISVNVAGTADVFAAARDAGVSRIVYASSSVGELARLAQVLLGVSGQPEQQAARPGDVLHSLADLTQSEKRLGYKPRIPLEEGLRLSVPFNEKAPGPWKP